MMNLKELVFAGLRFFYCKLIPLNVYKSNRKMLLEYKDKYKGKRCFIIGNGPSLKVEDLEKLDNEICFGMNHIYRIYDKTSWRPTFWCMQDMNYLDEMNGDLSNVEVEGMIKFLRMQSFKQIRKRYSLIKDLLLVPIWQVYKRNTTKYFSDRAEKYIFDGGTVTYMAMQIAAYMGFSEVYLLGVDFSFPFTYDANTKKYTLVDINQAAHFYETKADNDEKKGLHFSVNYELNLSAYCAAQAYCEQHEDFKIYNATRGGKLEVFPRVDFDKLISK